MPRKIQVINFTITSSPGCCIISHSIHKAAVRVGSKMQQQLAINLPLSVTRTAEDYCGADEADSGTQRIPSVRRRTFNEPEPQDSRDSINAAVAVLWFSVAGYARRLLDVARVTQRVPYLD